MSSISKKYRKSNTLTLSRFDQSMGAPIVLGIVFFFILCLGAADVIRSTAMIAAIFMLLVAAVRFKVLRERIHLPFLALTLYVIMDGVSTFYAVSGKFALREFLKVFLAYLLSVILLATSPKKEETTGKRVLSVLAVCTALGSLVSIDLISTRWISGAVTGVLGLFTESYADLDGLLENSRITSIFSNPNVFGGFTGLGILLSLELSESAASRRERCFFLAILSADALAFLLSNNRGALIFILIACLAYFLLKQKGSRIGVLLLLIESFVIAMAATAVVTKTSFGAYDGVRLIPLLALVIGAAVLCLVDSTVTGKLVLRLKDHEKKAMLVTGGLLALAVVFAAAALSLTGDTILARQQRFIRVAYPAAGSYSLAVETEGEALNVTVQSQNAQEAMLKEYNVLYSGSAYEASFDVPEDSRIVMFVFQAPEGAHLISASYDGRRIPLRYYLLPGAIADRLHSTSVFSNLIQRLVYFRDGFKLFRRSPVVGLGMGAFENAIKSVQSYYYETKYAHNHYFQTLLETGVVGLLLFLSLLYFSAAAVWKARKKHPYAPALGAALVFMAGQALTDIIFSAYAYLPVAFGTVAAIDLCCCDGTERPKLGKTAKTAVLGVSAACVVVYCVFLGGNMLAKKKVENMPTMNTLVEASRLDRFEWADYALPYVINAMSEDVDYNVRTQADAFAERLGTVNSNTIPVYLAEYYFRTGRTEAGIAMLEKYVDYVSSDQNAWQKAVDMLRAFAEDSDAFRSGAAELARRLETWNAENLGKIRLDDAASAFLAEYAAK